MVLFCLIVVGVLIICVIDVFNQVYYKDAEDPPPQIILLSERQIRLHRLAKTQWPRRSLSEGMASEYSSFQSDRHKTKTTRLTRRMSGR
jgi:hypothetical protein